MKHLPESFKRDSEIKAELKAAQLETPKLLKEISEELSTISSMLQDIQKTQNTLQVIKITLESIASTLKNK